jgi:hypothetical protein
MNAIVASPWHQGGVMTVRSARSFIVSLALVSLLGTSVLQAFYEDVCQPRRGQTGPLSWCLKPTCVTGTNPNDACVGQAIDFLTVKPGRSMVHADSTYFIAQSLGFRSDVAYWIVAYNEVTDYAQYVPIDQCGIQAANQNAIALGNTTVTVPNSGRDYITAAFNGFQRTNAQTDGPLDHYVVSYSPNGTGTDVHGPAGVSALYPLHYPVPGYPFRIDDTFQKTLANLRQWAMLPTSEPGVLCTVGLTETSPEGVTRCVTGVPINGTVPMIQGVARGVNINITSGQKVLNLITKNNATEVTLYPELGSWLGQAARTTGKLWKDPVPGPVPVELARIGLYLHVLQDTSSHSTYCGDDPPSAPGGCDPGTYMFMSTAGVKLSFGNSCVTGPHLAGHIQETGTGTAPLPLRDYVALNNTVNELIVFGNEVAKHHEGWIVNPELLPPDVVGGKNVQGKSAADIQEELVGTIVKGQAYSGTEVYQSGIVTKSLQQVNAMDRLHAMNATLGAHSATLRARSANPSAFVAFEPMPGNSFNPHDTGVCWQPLPGIPGGARGSSRAGR